MDKGAAKAERGTPAPRGVLDWVKFNFLKSINICQITNDCKQHNEPF